MRKQYVRKTTSEMIKEDLMYQLKVFCNLLGRSYTDEAGEALISVGPTYTGKTLSEIAGELFRINLLLRKVSGCEEREEYLHSEACSSFLRLQ